MASATSSYDRSIRYFSSAGSKRRSSIRTPSLVPSTVLIMFLESLETENAPNLTGHNAEKQRWSALALLFDSKATTVLVYARFNRFDLFSGSIWVPREGRIGKRVRTPRGRATVIENVSVL